MSHRTQITLADEQYERLRRESARTGLGLAELVRRAIDARYGTSGAQATLAALEESFGTWPDSGDGAEYVDDLRPGMASRVASR